MLTRDISGGAWDYESVPFAMDGFTGLLAQNVAQTITVPDNYPYWEMQVQCTPGIEVWVDGIGAATIPAGAISASTSQLIASGELRRYVKGGQTISLITGNAGGARISVQFLVAQLYTN